MNAISNLWYNTQLVSCQKSHGMQSRFLNARLTLQLIGSEFSHNGQVCNGVHSSVRLVDDRWTSEGFLPSVDLDV